MTTTQDRFVTVTNPATDSGFAVTGAQDAEVAFAREQLLDGWDQERIASARVMVVGAGALGNEVLKNLALLGFRHLFIVDLDMVAPSNLSRSVLFSRADQGRSKAATAARRTRRLCLAHPAQVRAFNGDVTLDLGAGVYRRMDVVVGCVDNIAARLAADAHCWLFGVPWVEGGIAGYQGSVTVFVPPEGPCYLCTLSRADRANERRRYSCDQRRQRYALANQIPAIQTVSSVVAATQVQETLKLLQGERAPRTIFYDGQTNQMSQSTMGVLANHRLHHPSLVDHPIRELRALRQTTLLHEALRLLAATLGSADVTIRLDHPFIGEAVCAACGHTEPVLRPLPRIWADEYQVCSRCGSTSPPGAAEIADLAIRLAPYRELSAASPAAFHSRSLGDLGIPALHVLQVRSGPITHYVELTGDLPAVLGRWP